MSGPQCKWNYGKTSAFDFLVLPLTLRRMMSGGDDTTASKTPRIVWVCVSGITITIIVSIAATLGLLIFCIGLVYIKR